MSSKVHYKFSRYLLALLRHRAISLGYTIDDRGYVSVDEILSKCNNMNLSVIKTIVETDNKSRFELTDRGNNTWYIRAVQGHSMPGINPDLVLVTDSADIPFVVHGTNPTAYDQIKMTGLNRMERSHIHFAHGTPDDVSVVSGMRKNSSVLIFIDAAKAMADGIQFYKSSNGVILSNGINGVIDCKYFAKVEYNYQIV